MQDFKDELVAFSKVAITRAERVTSEEAGKRVMVKWILVCIIYLLSFGLAQLEVGNWVVMREQNPMTDENSGWIYAIAWDNPIGYEGVLIVDYVVCYLNSTPEWSRLKAAILRFTRVQSRTLRVSDKNVFT